MRLYEVMLILSPDLDEAGMETEVERLTDLLESEGAKVLETDHWGRRRFAYELDHQTEGYYTVLQVEGDPRALDQLDRVASLSDQVLRHKVIRLPERASTSA